MFGGMFKAFAQKLAAEPPQTLLREVDLGAITEMHRIGFQPFIMIRVGGWSARESWLICETQDDAPRFVHDIVANGLAARNPFIGAIDKALRLETAAAAGLLCAWATGGKSVFSAALLRDLPWYERGRHPFYVGYPVFEVQLSAPERASSKEKSAFLAAVADIYTQLPGNDSLRKALADAFSLAARRAQESLSGSPADAAPLVSR